MPSLELHINGAPHEVNVDSGTPLLWVLRDVLNLTGTEYGCGMGQCGACTVHLGGLAVRSCQMPIGSIGTQEVTTIEGLSSLANLHHVQQALRMDWQPQGCWRR